MISTSHAAFGHRLHWLKGRNLAWPTCWRNAGDFMGISGDLMKFNWDVNGV